MFGKTINTKLYHNENKLIQIKNALEENNENIIKYHNNILNETVKTDLLRQAMSQVWIIVIYF